MPKTERLFEIISHACQQAGTDEFDFAVEWWGAYWMPTWLYVRNHPIEGAAKEYVSSEDLEEMRKARRVELVREYSNEELGDEIEISRQTYRILNRELAIHSAIPQ